MFEKLAHDIETAAIRKLAAVPGDVKQYRRAIQMLRSGSHDFHGTGGPGFRKVLDSGYIRPGDNSMLSPMVRVKGSTENRGLPEVYMGSGKPPYPYMAGGFPGIAVDKHDMSRLSAPEENESSVSARISILMRPTREQSFSLPAPS